MELEDQEGFNNTSNYPPKPYKSSSTKKYHGERPSIFNLNVPLSEKNLTQFLNSFDKTKSTETQLEFINVLLKASPDTLEKFAHTHGVGILARLLHESARNLSSRVELVDRILTYFNKVSLTKDMLTKSRIHAAIEDVKNSPEPVEEISNKAFKLLIKWREVIKEWTEEGGEKQAEDYERERRIARSFIKRTSRFSGEGKSDSRSPEDRSMDPMKRPRDARRMMRPRHDSFPRRGGKNYEGGHRYMRRNGHGHSDSEEDDESDYSERKTVRWNEDPVLVKVKYFRFNDEPTHRALTEEEVTQAQEKIGEENRAVVVPAANEDIKHKESQMEGRSLKMRRDNEKEIQDKLDAMVETIKWYRPIKLDLRENVVPYGRDSRENQEHQKRISTKLPCFYLKENQIPSQPSYDNVKSVKKEIVAPVVVPLANSTADREPEENQDIFKALETFVQRNAPEAGPATTTDKKQVQVQGSPAQTAQDNAPKPVEQKEQKKVTKMAQPARGILKKSREQLAKEREEAARLEEERRKEREKEKKGLSLDSDLVMKLMNGELSQEEQEDVVNRLKESGDADGLLQNIATLRKFMTNVQQTGKPKKKEGNFRPPPHSFGQEPKKMMKPNTEPQTNMLAGGMPPQQDEMPHGGPGYQDEYMDEGNPRFNRGPGGPGGPRGPMGMGDRPNKMNKKVPFRPANYKTVPCVWFHSPKGCPYGDSCNFIHDPNHAGRQTPNMHKYVRPIDQLGTKGRDSEGPESPGGMNYPPSGNTGPSSFYGIGGGRDNRESMSVEKTPNMGMQANPNTGGGAPYMNAPMNQGQGMHSGPGQQHGGGYHRMNQPHHQGYHSGGHGNMNQMPYNRMGGGPHHGGGGHHMGGYHGGPHSHPGHGGQQHYSHGQGRQGDHGGYHGNYGGNQQQQDHMMMRNEHSNYRNDMMYQPQQPQHNNPRMPYGAPHSMPMQMGYNPMPPKNVMPPTGGGYGMMDPNKGKE